MRKDHPAASRNLGEDFVYQNATIQCLSTYIVQLVTGSACPLQDAIRGKELSKVEQMEAMVEELVSSLQQDILSSKADHHPSSVLSQKDVVLLTGTTGALGSNLLAQLLSDDAIERVYALNRRSFSGRTLVERQEDVFKHQGLDVELLKSAKLHLLEADASAARLGLSHSLYTEASD